MIKKVFFALLWIVAIPFAGRAQIDSVAKNDVFLGLSLGIDNNMNAFAFNWDKDYSYYYYSLVPQYNFGVDASFMLTSRIRPRMELKYVNVKYGVTWQASSYDFDNTIVSLSYFDLNFRADYLLVNTKRFNVFVSPGLKLEFKTGSSLSTLKWNIMELRHPRSIAGGAISMIFKYNISNNVGLTVVPEYTYFCRRFAAGNTKQYQRFSGNIGVEFKL